MARKLRCLLGPLRNGEAPRFSSLVQGDVAAIVEEVGEVGDSGVQMRRCVARLKMRRQRGESEKEPLALLIRLERISDMRGNQGDQKMDM